MLASNLRQTEPLPPRDTKPSGPRRVITPRQGLLKRNAFPSVLVDAPTPPLAVLSLCRLAKADARPSSVLVDELHAGHLECSANDFHRRMTGLVGACLELTNRHNANSGTAGEVLLAPGEQPTRRSALRRCDHGSRNSSRIEIDLSEIT